MPGFCEVAAIYIVVAVYRTYLNQWLQIRWRRWMTRRFLDEWLADRGLLPHQPDHRQRRRSAPTTPTSASPRTCATSSTARSRSASACCPTSSRCSASSASCGACPGAIDAARASRIPGYMVWVALIYAVIGTWLTHLVGRPLAALNFRQQRVEADFRYALVRLRENVEGIALYRRRGGGEGQLAQRFARGDRQLVGDHAADQAAELADRRLRADRSRVPDRRRRAPRYFSGAIQLGGLTQTAGAFGQVQGSLSWFVTRPYAAARGAGAPSSSVSPLSTARSSSLARGRTARAGRRRRRDGSRARDLTIELPDGTQLLRDADLTLRRGQSVVITGRSGSGKSTLFRASRASGRSARAGCERPAGTLPVPAAAALHPARHAAPCRRLSRPMPEAFDRGGDRAGAGGRGSAAIRAHLDEDENGRSSSRGASSSGWRSRGRCWPNPTGCSSTRPPRASIRRRRRNSTAC